MLTNPNAKRVLLYGDSLFYGKVPSQNHRWPADVRFTGIAQQELGDMFDLIEEGLRARTMRGENGYFPNRDGLAHFNPILGSHLPCSAIVLMLGTNDANSRSGLSPDDVAETLRYYLRSIEEWSEFLEIPKAPLLVVGSPNIVAEQFDDSMATIFGAAAPAKAQEIREALEHKAGELGLAYFDSSVCCTVGSDGIHLDELNNQKLGKALAKFIKENV